MQKDFHLWISSTLPEPLSQMMKSGGGNVNINISADDAAALGMNSSTEMVVLIPHGVED